MPENNQFYRQVMQRYPPYCSDKELNNDFIAALLRAFEEKPFNAADFNAFSIDLILEYIRRTHDYYLKKKLPEIEQSILLLGTLYASHHPVLTALSTFFKRYSAELTAHINGEEQLLLPHIDFLRRSAEKPSFLVEGLLSEKQYSIAEFLKNHEDTEDELKEIRETVRLYKPPAGNQSLYRILLLQLQTFEQDLSIHAHIEDEVLIPKAKELEALVFQRLAEISRWN